MTITVHARVASRKWAAFGRKADLAALATRAMAAGARVARLQAAADVNALFCDDAEIRDLNRRFRGFDKATNVLSFPGVAAPGGPAELGDVAIAAETCLAEAEEQHKTPQDHVAHLLVHGFLHLVGYDHGTAVEARRMEAAERRALAAIGVADPYAGTIAARRSAS